MDVSIYRDRIQIEQRGDTLFVDQRAEFAFSSDQTLIAHQRFFEDTLVRGLRKILDGGFSLRYPIAHIVRYDGDLSDTDRMVIEESFREAGIEDVLFELREDQF